MKCAHPFMRDTQGKIRWSTKLTEEQKLDMTPFPCGHCLPCKINKARTWQHRIMLESRSHSKNAFVTLTYEDKFLTINNKGDPILQKKELQKFLKRLRKMYPPNSIRYFAVGEYGDKTQRPHYHIMLFGLGKEDEEEIQKAWSLKKEPIGMIDIGNVEPESARYIAGYTIKKLTKEGDPRLEGKKPEFMLSSRKGGGIGKTETIRIGNLIKSNPYFDSSQILNSFTIGGKPFPLGGYLTKILSETIGDQDEYKKTAFETYQQQLFNENGLHTEEYYFNIIKNSEQYRLNLEKKHKIFTKDKTI